MKKVIFAAMALLLVLSLISGCAAPPQKEGGSTAAEGKPDGSKTKFAFIIPALDANWYKEICDSFEYAAEEVGAEVMILPSDYSEDVEVSNIDLAITEKVDGLVMFSFNENGAKLAAQKCAEAGIPLVVPDSVGQALNAGTDIVACVDFDWEEMGHIYADWMAENTKGDYVIITGNFEHYPCIYVNKGMEDRSKELGKNKLVEIYDANYEPDQAAAIAEDIVNSGVECETIFVMMEEMAASVVRVLKNAGKLNNPYKVISQNGQQIGIDLISKGDMAMTIASSPGLEGYICFRILFSQINGKINYKNKQVMCPITKVEQKDTENPDPKVIVPWHRDPVFVELTKEYLPDLMWY